MQAAQEAEEAAQLPSVPAKLTTTPPEEVAQLKEELPEVPTVTHSPTCSNPIRLPFNYGAVPDTSLILYDVSDLAVPNSHSREQLLSSKATGCFLWLLPVGRNNGALWLKLGFAHVQHEVKLPAKTAQEAPGSSDGPLAA